VKDRNVGPLEDGRSLAEDGMLGHVDVRAQTEERGATVRRYGDERRRRLAEIAERGDRGPRIDARRERRHGEPLARARNEIVYRTPATNARVGAWGRRTRWDRRRSPGTS